MRQNISAVIITFNEEKNIRRCLESLQDLVGEILVVDSFSNDRTEEICKEYSVRFVQHAFEGHIQQKNYAMEQASNDWILSLDADEALTDELKGSIDKVDLNHSDGFQLKRLTNFCGKWIRHTGWYPDKKIRLWNRQKGRWGGLNPHDRVELNSVAIISELKGDLLHYSFYNFSEHTAQIQKFSSLAAQAAYEKGKKSNLIFNILLGPLYTFVKKYFIQAGFLDGYFGFVISINTAYSKFLKYIKLRELHKNG